MVRETAIAVQANIPVLRMGKPGIGKTAGINALARALNYEGITIIAALREPSDFGGLPVLIDGAVHLAAPEWVRRANRARRALVFFDELTCAPPATQAGALRVIHERIVGDTALDPEVRIVAAANAVGDAAGGWELAPPLANRFCHLQDGIPSATFVADGMTSGWPAPDVPRVPDDWRTALPRCTTEVAAFLRLRPAHVHAMPREEGQYAWPSPRTWEMAATLMAAATAAGADDTVSTLVAGCVGGGVAAEFLTWRKQLDLPNPETLLRDPEALAITDRQDVLYAVAVSVVSAACDIDPSEARWHAAWKVLARIAGMNATDIAAAAARRLARKRKAGWKLPTREIQPFITLLKRAGLMQ